MNAMKRSAVLLTAIVAVCALVGCANDVPEVQNGPGVEKLYSRFGGSLPNGSDSDLAGKGFKENEKGGDEIWRFSANTITKYEVENGKEVATDEYRYGVAEGKLYMALWKISLAEDGHLYSYDEYVAMIDNGELASKRGGGKKDASPEMKEILKARIGAEFDSLEEYTYTLNGNTLNGNTLTLTENYTRDSDLVGIGTGNNAPRVEIDDGKYLEIEVGGKEYIGSFAVGTCTLRNEDNLKETLVVTCPAIVDNGNETKVTVSFKYGDTPYSVDCKFEQSRPETWTLVK